MNEPIGTQENPCTFENSSEASYGGKYCLCGACKKVALCTREHDFFKDTGRRIFVCEPCFDDNMRKEGLEMTTTGQLPWV